MARKRGGLAGFYDRNKGFLKKAVPVGLSFIPGVGIPLAAAAGAAMGADTEGKGYFSGFNVGGAIKGGLEGYGLGKGAQSVRGLLAPSGSNPSVLAKQIGMTPSAGGMPAGVGTPTMAAAPDIGRVSSLSSYVGTTPSAMTGPASVTNVASGVADAARNVPSLMGTGGGGGGSGVRGMLTGARNFMRENKDLIEMAGKGVQRFLPNPELDIKQQEMDLAQAKFDEEKRLTQMEQERRQRIAQLLMPYLQQNYGQYFGGQ